MEALDSTRQSNISALVHREDLPDRPLSTTTTTTTTTTMAAAAVISPTTSIYSNGPPPPYSSGWSALSKHSISGLISPPESRRTLDHKIDPPLAIQTNSPHRQSLPSIHEALSNTVKPIPYVSPVSASGPSPHQRLSYAQPQATRPYAPTELSQYSSQTPTTVSRNPSPPQPVHPFSNSFSRPEPVQPAFHDTRSAAPAPRTLYAGPRYEPSRFEQDPRVADRATAGYPHHPPPHAGYPYVSSPATGSAHHGPNFSQPRYQQRGGEADVWKKEEDKSGTAPFRQGLKRHLDVWDFENNLAQINVSSSALQEWSRHYNAIAQEQQRSVNVIPDRMPTIDSCNEMIEHQEKILAALLRMKDTIHQQDYVAMMDQRMREQGGKPAPGASEHDDDSSMYGDESKASGGFGGSEGKKRRGRAVPPGRCHSCNRAETPEWRRGPDGARTLCNACGLHYAKLTRKNTIKQAQNQNQASGPLLRPKSMEGVEQRPL